MKKLTINHPLIGKSSAKITQIEMKNSLNNFDPNHNLTLINMSVKASIIAKSLGHYYYDGNKIHPSFSNEIEAGSKEFPS